MLLFQNKEIKIKAKYLRSLDFGGQTKVDLEIRAFSFSKGIIYKTHTHTLNLSSNHKLNH